MTFIVNKQKYFEANSAIYSADTRNWDHLQTPNAKLLFYSGIKICNSQPIQ